MVNSIEVGWMNKTNQFHNKVRAYSAHTLKNLPLTIDHLKPNLRKARD